jgi:spermidine/putrescine transport system ATP-binding protein
MGAVTPEGEAAPGPVIVLDHVSKRFSDFVAVHDADFSIGRGEFFSMLGPSGCGKTTTLRMIAGFESPSSGRILLDGEDVSHTPPYRRNVNTVFQQYALFPHMNVFDNVAFGLRSRRVAKDEVSRSVGEMLEIVRMGDFGKRRPLQLSGGQQQRVALARALVNKPAALLLDEPLAALDLKLRQAMQLELKRIQRDTKVTFIFVTHDQQEALTMSDHIAVMSDGWVEQIGSPTDIYQRPATPFVAGFIGEANLLPGTFKGRQGAVASVAIAGGTIAVPDAPDAAGSVLVMVRPEKVQVGRDAPVNGQAGVPATVDEIIFRGATVHVGMTATDGTAMVAHLGDDRSLGGLRPGDPAWARWDRDVAYLVPAAGGHSAAPPDPLDKLDAPTDGGPS